MLQDNLALGSNIVRIGKPLAVAVLTFGSVFYLSGSASIALIVSSVPLLLGWLGVLATFAYSLAALTFLSAVAWATMPQEVKRIIAAQFDAFSNQLRLETEKGTPPR